MVLVTVDAVEGDSEEQRCKGDGGEGEGAGGGPVATDQGEGDADDAAGDGYETDESEPFFAGQDAFHGERNGGGDADAGERQANERGDEPAAGDGGGLAAPAVDVVADEQGERRGDGGHVARKFVAGEGEEDDVNADPADA